MVYQRVVPDSPFNVQPARPALDGYQVLFTKAADGIRQAGEFSVLAKVVLAHG